VLVKKIREKGADVEPRPNQESYKSIFSNCSLVYHHTQVEQAQHLKEIFTNTNFEKIHAVDEPAMVLALAIAWKPTFAFVGGGNCQPYLLDMALHINHYAPTTHCILQWPMVGEEMEKLAATTPVNIYPHVALCGLVQLLTSIIEKNKDAVPHNSSDGHQTIALKGPLTHQEERILQYVAKGWSNQQIADKLCLSYHTVKNHKSHIVKKMGFRHSSEMYLLAKKIKDG
jgi:DNA-binding CsgD family transcriptional regulator